MIRRGVAIAAILAIPFLFASAASAGVSYPPSPGISVSNNTVTAGSDVTVTGDSCGAGSAITVSFNGSVVATTTADGDGSFSVTFEVPPGTPPGTYSVTVTGCGADVLSATLTVVESGGAPNNGTGTTTLPRTGANDTTGFLLRVGVVLVALGAVTTLVVRRRTAHTS